MGCLHYVCAGVFLFIFFGALGVFVGVLEREVRDVLEDQILAAFPETQRVRLPVPPRP